MQRSPSLSAWGEERPRGSVVSRDSGMLYRLGMNQSWCHLSPGLQLPVHWEIFYCLSHLCCIFYKTQPSLLKSPAPKSNVYNPTSNLFFVNVLIITCSSKIIFLVLYPELMYNCHDHLSGLLCGSGLLSEEVFLSNKYSLLFLCRVSVWEEFVYNNNFNYLLSWREILWVLNSFLTDNYLQHLTKCDSSILYILLLPWRIKHPSLFCLLCWGNWVLPRSFNDILATKIASCVGACVWAHVCYKFQSLLLSRNKEQAYMILLGIRLTLLNISIFVILQTSINYPMNTIFWSSYAPVECWFTRLYFSLSHHLYRFSLTHILSEHPGKYLL